MCLSMLILFGCVSVFSTVTACVPVHFDESKVIYFAAALFRFAKQHRCDLWWEVTAHGNDRLGYIFSEERPSQHGFG